MMNSFSITYIYTSNDEKKLLFGTDDMPAKSEEDATYVMTPEDPEFEMIVSAIPQFRDAEPGAEETVTGTDEEFLDKYGLNIEDVEEEVGHDLDNDGCDPLDPDHMATDMPKKNDEEVYTDPFMALATESYSPYCSVDAIKTRPWYTIS